MEEDLTAALRGIVHAHYPRGVPADDPAYARSEESMKLEAARARAVADDGAWKRLLEALRAALPECRVDDWSHLALRRDASYRCRVELPPFGQSSHALVACVSVLAPFYLIYSSRVREADGRPLPPGVRYELAEGEARHGRVVASNIETVFGYSAMPPGAGTTIVPDVAVGNERLGEATLLDCLFTDDRW